MKDEGWVLSPDYDLNPSIDKDGLALNIDMDNNSLAKSVGDFFRLNQSEMDNILNEVFNSVKQWKEIAHKMGFSQSEQELMQVAFRFI